MRTRGILYSSDDEGAVRQVKEYRPRINFEVANPFCLKEKFRLSSTDVEQVLEQTGIYLHHETPKNHALSPEQQLLIALHWLGNGCQYHGVADMHVVVKSTVCRSVNAVLDVIIDHLFQEITPRENESFVDRYGNHSINTLMICGPDMNFFCVNPNWPGATHDARVLRNTIICNRFDEGWRPFPDAVILGDPGYEATDWLIPPVFKTRITRQRDASTIITKKQGAKKAGKVILVCAVLHNIARMEDFPYESRENDDEDYSKENQNARIQRLLQFF
ncbi:unnamed protein product [Allacma fusca]|uniref:DDE Tnp4 domain-containing protein n=1 Tax=Allacma fusca TaxID=39272 RepID=A0A8J2KMU1_9HEXA|nr:unnamed protein product [Allacma fusca]